jgi:hypothetical protein
MTIDTTRESATIHQFPARGRFAAKSNAASASENVATRLPRASIGSGWYHDDAIEEERARKN